MEQQTLENNTRIGFKPMLKILLILPTWTSLVLSTHIWALSTPIIMAICAHLTIKQSVQLNIMVHNDNIFPIIMLIFSLQGCCSRFVDKGIDFGCHHINIEQ